METDFIRDVSERSIDELAEFSLLSRLSAVTPKLATLRSEVLNLVMEDTVAAQKGAKQVQYSPWRSYSYEQSRRVLETLTSEALRKGGSEGEVDIDSASRLSTLENDLGQLSSDVQKLTTQVAGLIEGMGELKNLLRERPATPPLDRPSTPQSGRTNLSSPAEAPKLIASPVPPPKHEPTSGTIQSGDELKNASNLPPSFPEYRAMCLQGHYSRAEKSMATRGDNSGLMTKFKQRQQEKEQ